MPLFAPGGQNGELAGQACDECRPEDYKHGGHLLVAASDGVTAAPQRAPSIELGRPLTLDLLTMERTHDMEADLDKVER